MIHITDEHLARVPSYDVYVGDFPVVKLDNREEFDILCPVSVVTGHRTSVQEAMLHLTNDNMELANVLVEDLQSTYSDERLSVRERLDLVKERLSTGSFAENDAFMKYLGDFIQLNYPQKPEIQGVLQKTVEKTVESVESVESQTKE